MLCVAINGPTQEKALHQIEQALKDADLVELRLDHFTHLDDAFFKHLRSSYSIPMIFTLRDPSQGGLYQGSENERLKMIRHLAHFKPAYLDLESHLPAHFAEEITRQHPEIKLIISYHDFTHTTVQSPGKPLRMIYEEMQKIPACFYKIAVNAQTPLDALRMLHFMHESNKKIIGVSMGEEGQLSRILGPVFDCPITYASFEGFQKTAPGQLTVQTLLERYRWRSLNRHTAIYVQIEGLAEGETPNVIFEAYGLNAILIKMRVHAAELTESLQLAKALRFNIV
jgi:3-dehydroquinate dehydratase / shikimate dehydrogenase